MKTVDEVINFLEGKQANGEWLGISDAVYYLKEYQNIFLAEKMSDPNLPLTWEDLCKLDMIGSPVWNGHTHRWMLIIDSANDGTWIDLVNHAGGKEHWIEHDLRKNPLYRNEKKMLKISKSEL